jgi:hypothetical protein
LSEWTSTYIELREMERRIVSKGRKRERKKKKERRIERDDEHACIYRRHRPRARLDMLNEPTIKVQGQIEIETVQNAAIVMQSASRPGSRE